MKGYYLEDFVLAADGILDEAEESNQDLLILVENSGAMLLGTHSPTGPTLREDGQCYHYDEFVDNAMACVADALNKGESLEVYSQDFAYVHHFAPVRDLTTLAELREELLRQTLDAELEL